jgi:hypothetical protein
MAAVLGLCQEMIHHQHMVIVILIPMPHLRLGDLDLELCDVLVYIYHLLMEMFDLRLKSFLKRPVVATCLARFLHHLNELLRRHHDDDVAASKVCLRHGRSTSGVESFTLTGLSSIPELYTSLTALALVAVFFPAVDGMRGVDGLFFGVCYPVAAIVACAGIVLWRLFWRTVSRVNETPGAVWFWQPSHTDLGSPPY